MSLELTVGDTGPVLAGNVNADLTGAAAAVHIRRPDGTVINRAAVIPAGTEGAWTLPLIVGDLTIAGDHAVELQVTFSDTTIETFRLGSDGKATSFYVADQIA